MRYCLIALISLLLGATACNSTPPPTQHYALTGKVESVDNSHQTISVDGDAVAGFMPAMTMDYKVKNPEEIKLLKPGDSISATLVKQQDDYWLENVKITPPAPSPSKPQVK